jgi:DinB superfamily
MNALDILKYGHLTLMQTLEGFPTEARERSGACGEWSVKDIVAHLASFEKVLVDVLSVFDRGGPTPYLTKFTTMSDEFNDSEVVMRRENTMAEVLHEYEEANAQVMELAARLSAETFRQTGTLPWYGMDYALDDFIVFAFYGHKREHSAQVATFRDHVQ